MKKKINMIKNKKNTNVYITTKYIGKKLQLNFGRVMFKYRSTLSIFFYWPF